MHSVLYTEHLSSQQGVQPPSPLPPSSPPIGESPQHRPTNVGTSRSTCWPSQAASHHLSPPTSSPPAGLLQPPARGCVLLNVSSATHLPPGWHTHCATLTCYQHAANTRHSCSCLPTPCPQHCPRQSHKCHREYQDGSNDDVPASQGRTHHRYVIILATTQ